MQRAILVYFAFVALVIGRPDLDNQTSTKSTVNISPTTKQEIPTTPSGCFYDGKWYPRNSEISRGFDGRSWCYGTYCDQSGQIVVWDNFQCSTPAVTTSSPTTTPTTLPEKPTTLLPSSTPVGCYHNGRWFLPGSEISRGSSYGWCYGMYCDTHGSIVAWDNWSCSTTSRPTTIPITTPPYLTTERPLGCNFRGWLYALGSEISQTWISGERCYGKRCSNDGQIITWLAFDCHSGRGHIQNKKNGCFYRGHFYRRGMEIFRRQSSGRCFEGSCKQNALIKWKSLSCNKERKFLAGQRRMCSYRGQLYPRGSIIHSRSLYKSRGSGWCVGIKCGRNRKIAAWGPAWRPGDC